MSELARKLVGVVQPSLWGGGAEAVTFWVLQALKEQYHVDLLTFDTVNLEAINRFYGTHLQFGDFGVVTYPLPAVLRTGEPRFSLLRQHLIMRYCKLRARGYDLLFSTCNEMDFGRPGIQYINLPVLAETTLREQGLLTSKKWYHRRSVPRRVYHLMCQALSNYSEERMKSNLTLANSNWTATLVRETYDIEARTVYPPVPTDFPDVPYQSRETGFVSVGRIVPDKRILELIRILRAVREQGFDIHLHIIGAEGDRGYARKVRAQQKENASWVFLEGALDRPSLVRMITEHKFGIHGMRNEHFGIAVAEMAKAGCVVFVPDGGGQREIVDSDTRVVYRDQEDAVEKIIRVLRNKRGQEPLSKEIQLHGGRFSPERFMECIRRVVKEF